MDRYAGFVALLAVITIAGIYSYIVTPREASTDVARPGIETGRPSISPEDLPKGSGFDFYVLALSWSPTFCQTAEAASNRDQCGTSQRFGLIVHGLWPQYERGYPQSCPSNEPGRVPSSLGRQYLDIMPSMGLIGHQWRKHGTCTGLSQEDYFSTVRKAFERIHIPDSLREAKNPIDLSVAAIETQFTESNDGLSGRGLAVTCEDGKLEEVRICLTGDLDFRDCPTIDYQACPLKSVAVPPPR